MCAIFDIINDKCSCLPTVSCNENISNTCCVDMLWCATTKNYDANKRWGECSLTKGAPSSRTMLHCVLAKPVPMDLRVLECPKEPRC